MASKTLVVTCGPAYAPIDGMRRLTNASTGKLGLLLANALVDKGHRVLLYIGEGATAVEPSRATQTFRYGTNHDLERLLQQLGKCESIDGFFHAAALSDFEVKEVRDDRGNLLTSGKICSHLPECTLVLKPAPKILPRLREWFAGAMIVGWKFEVDGTREEALAKGEKQLRESGNNLCVVNGPAYGEGFGLVGGRHGSIHLAGLVELIEVLTTD